MHDREGVVGGHLVGVPALRPRGRLPEGQVLHVIRERAVLLLAEAVGELLDEGDVPKALQHREDHVALHPDGEEADGRVGSRYGTTLVGVLGLLLEGRLRQGLDGGLLLADDGRGEVIDVRQVLGNPDSPVGGRERRQVSVRKCEGESADGVSFDLRLDALGARGLLGHRGLERRLVAVEVLCEDQAASRLLCHPREERSVRVVAVLDERGAGDLGAQLLADLEDVRTGPLVVAAVTHEGE